MSKNYLGIQASVPWFVLSALLVCMNLPCSAAPDPVPAVEQSQTGVLTQTGPKEPRFLVLPLSDQDLYENYCRLSETDAGLTALLDKTNFLPDSGCLYSLYRAAASEYMPELRSYLYQVDSSLGEAVAINNHSEILFRSGTIYKWTGKGVNYLRSTAGPPFPVGYRGKALRRQIFLAPDARGMNDAGVVVGYSWRGVYICAPGGSATILGGASPSYSPSEGGDNSDGYSEESLSAADPAALAEIAEAVAAIRRQRNLSPGRGPSRRGIQTGSARDRGAGNALPNPGLEAEDLRHKAICDAADRILPQGRSTIVVPSASDDFFADHLSEINVSSMENHYSTYIDRINNKGHMLAQTPVIADESQGTLFVDSPCLFGQNNQFTSLDSVLPLLTKPKTASAPAAVETASRPAKTSGQPGAHVLIPWGTSLTNQAGTFRVQDLNDQDHLAGTISTDVDSDKLDPHSGLLRENAALWNGEMVVLRGPANSVATQAYALNNRDQVVGICRVSSTKDGSQDRAALWQDGKVYDLNACIPPGSGWTLFKPRAINDKGEIVGRGAFQGQSASFLLIPVGGTPYSAPDKSSSPNSSEKASP